jgi:integrase
MFSLLVAGINMRDIAYLKNKNVTKEIIEYDRQKTKRTSRVKQKIRIIINQEVCDIISALAVKNGAPDDYVFPILSNEMEAADQDRRIRQFIKVTNQNIKQLCEQNKLKVFTTYSARHSFANILKQGDISSERIRELLGHKDLKTTENYLRRFDLDKNREAMQTVMKALKKTA